MKNEKLKNLSEKLKERKVCSGVADFNFSEKSQKKSAQSLRQPLVVSKIILTFATKSFSTRKNIILTFHH